MSVWTSPREKGIFTSDQALEFTDQIHIPSFPGWASSPPSMCSPSGTHDQCRQTGTGLRAEEARTLGTRLPIVMGLRSCLSPPSLLSRDCESALKGREGLHHSPEKGSNRTLHLGCETWNAPTLVTALNFLFPSTDALTVQTKPDNGKNVRAYPKSLLCPLACNHFALSSISRPNTWICSLYLGFS